MDRSQANPPRRRRRSMPARADTDLTPIVTAAVNAAIAPVLAELAELRRAVDRLGSATRPNATDLYEDLGPSPCARHVQAHGLGPARAGS